MLHLYDILNNMHFISSKDYNFKTKKWFFISGPMRGIDDYNRKAFDECEEKLYEISGHDPNIYNPVRMLISDEKYKDKPFTYGMKKSLRNLISKRDWGRGVYYVDAIVLLPGWEDSYGALVEAIVAYECGIDLVTWDE